MLLRKRSFLSVTGSRQQCGRRRYASNKDLVSLLKTVPRERMLTFSIIAHVDHGKSSLSQRLLERQGNIATPSSEKSNSVSQEALDTLSVERERGITVKAVTATMAVQHHSETWLINLTDTPGHVDFNNEVRRSLAACNGALLLVDAAQGIEAQTLSTARAAELANVPLLAACSKCDLDTARPEEIALELCELGLLDDPDTILQVSAKTGQGLDEVLPRVIDAFGIERPTRSQDDSQDEAERSQVLRVRIIDSRYDEKRGVVCVIQVISGELREKARVSIISSSQDAFSNVSEASYSVQEVGLLTPAQLRTGSLPPGAVGYVIFGLRDVRGAAVGDTLYETGCTVQPLEKKLRPSRPGLYASVFPPDGALFDDMARAVDRLALNDPAVTVTREPPRPVLGLGLRCGFLGLLHMDVFRQRLADEFQEDVLFCAPTVPYRAAAPTSLQLDDDNVLITNDTADEDNFESIENLEHWPVEAITNKRLCVLEPVVDLVVMAPQSHLGAALQVLESTRGIQMQQVDASQFSSLLNCRAPWASVVEGLGEKLAQATQGYASLQVADQPRWRRNDRLVKLDIAINNETIHALSAVVDKEDAYTKGRQICELLRSVIPRQQFEVVIQAKLHTRNLAKERLAPVRKDVLTTKAGKTVGGGDVTRKKKVLEKQKAGKKRAKTVARGVQLDQETFWTVLGMPSTAGGSNRK